jgi:hypothetical protein
MNFLKSLLTGQARLKRSVEAGWLIQTDEAAFIWGDPVPLKHGSPSPAAKSADRCPAIRDLELNTFEIACPFDIKLRYIEHESGPQIVEVSGIGASLNGRVLGKVLNLTSPTEWRHPKRPIIQFPTPYRFVSDAMVYLNQYPPFAEYRAERLPGIVLSGRFPIHIWPRKLSWAFEWHDTTKDLVLQRGEPWFYVRLEGPAPVVHVKLVKAELTPQLAEYCTGLDGVTNYVNRTFSLFKTANLRRPEKLLSATRSGS